MWLLVSLSATFLGLFLVYPLNYYSRYTLFITGLGIIAFSLVLTYVSGRTRVLVKIIAVQLALLVVATNFVLCNFTPRAVRDQLVSLKSSLKSGSPRGAIYNNIPGRAFSFAQERTQKDEVIAYDSKPFFIYPLWKPDFSNKVIYVPADSENDWYNKLRTNNVRYVLTTPNSQERQWAKDKLKNIYKDEYYEIHQVY